MSNLGGNSPSADTDKANNLVGPPGPQGQDSTIPGPEGPTSTVPGPEGPPGADSTVPGPAGADSTVPGPPGETGADSTVPGPAGADSTVPGPAGEDGVVASVVGGTNTTVDATDPANPIVNVPDAMTKAVYDQNSNNRADVSELIIIDVRFTEAVTAGDLVFFSGYNVGQDLPECQIADITDAGKRPAVGFVDTTTIINENGTVSIIGSITAVDTSSFTAGDVLYLNTAGTVTNTETSPLMQVVGIVTRSNAVNGRIAGASQQVIDVSGGASPTTTKGDMIVRDATQDIRLPVGNNDWIIIADSTEASGVKWIPQTPIDPSPAPLTTKGDVYGYDTEAKRIPIGTNDQVLTADSTAALGLAWKDAAAGAGSTSADGAKIEKTTSTNFIGTGFQTLVFAAEAYDDNGYADLGADDDRLTVPSGVTRINITFNIQYTSSISISANWRVQIEHYNSADALQEIVSGMGMSIGFGDHFANCTASGVVVVAGDYFKVILICADSNTTAAKYDLVIQDTQTAGPVGPIGPGGATQIELSMFVQGVPTDAEKLATYVAATSFTLPVGLLNSQSFAEVVSTAAATIDVQVNGVSKGTIQFALGASAATYTFASPVGVVAGDRIQFINQGTADATLADISFTIRGTV